MNRLKQVWCSASLALVLAVTASTGCVLLVVGLFEVYDNWARANPSTASGYSERLVVAEGQGPIIQRFHRQPYGKTQSFDHKHQPVVISADKRRLTSADLPSQRRRYSDWLRRRGSSRRPRRVATGVRNSENWYVVYHGKRSDSYFFQGLKIDGGETVGFIGRDGFQETKPDAESQFMAETVRFRAILENSVSVANESQIVLRDDRRLLRVNFARRTVKPVINEPIVSMDRLDRRMVGSHSSTSSRDALWALRTRERIEVVRLDDGIRRAFVIPQELRDRAFGFFTLKDGALYFLGGDAPELSEADVWTQRRELVWASRSGEVTRRETVTLSETGPRSSRGMSDEARLRWSVAAVPGTLWSAGLAFGGFPWLFGQVNDGLTFSKAFRQTAGHTWWVVVLVAIFCGWLARLAYRHQQQQGEPNGWFWGVFVFLFGLPGYVGYRLHRNWPHREAIPAPEPTGYEVFAN